MEQKFLVDVGVGKKVEKWLINQGYDTKSVRDVDPRMTDTEILKMAVSERRMVVTMDKDFGELIYNSGSLHGGVLLLRLEDAISDEKVKAVENVFGKYGGKMLNKFCVYKDGRLRIRK